MPTKTKMLDCGNFVYSPKLPANRSFSEYLDFADRLLKQWREVQEECNCSPFSSELGKRKGELDEVLSDFVDSFKGRYSIRSVGQDPTFLPVSQFFAQYRPIRQPFSILHCNLEMPLHTVHKFQSDRDLAKINAALDEDTPFRWWQPGPHGQPCYLFGEWVWKLKPAETRQSEEGIVLLFLELSEKHQHKRDQLRHGCWQTTATASTDFIPEKVMVLVWRRAHGKCAKCGTREKLEFDYITALDRGGTCTPGNIQMLCKRCYGRKHVVI